MEKGSDGIAHLSSASLEVEQDDEIEKISKPNLSGLRAGVESHVQNSDGEVEAKGATASLAKNEVESLLIKPSVAKTSEDAEVLPIKRNVIARIIRKEVVPDEERREERQRVNDFGHNWDGALTILEYGLVLYQTIRALFIDCSFYLVIVMCGGGA